MRRFIYAGVVAMVAVSGCGLTGWRVVQSLSRRSMAAAETEEAAATAVDVVTAEPRDLVDAVRIPGTVRARHEADVVSDVPGRVEAVLVDVGSIVRKGDVLARLETVDIRLQAEQAEAGLAMAEAARASAARDLEAAQSVAEVGGVSDSQLVAARARAATADAQVMQARAALGLARERLADATLRSPLDGVVTRRLTDIGRLVAPGSPAFSVQDLSELQLVVAVDERVAARLRAGDEVEVTNDHVAGPIAGTIRTVSPALDAQSRKGEVVVGMPAVVGLLPQATATARFELGRAVGVVALPAHALLEEGDDAVVYVVDDGKARRTVVHPGLRDGDWVEVRGLSAGLTVVASGHTLLSDGTPVAVRRGS